MKHGKRTGVNDFWKTWGVKTQESVAQLNDDQRAVRSNIDEQLSVRSNIAAHFIRRASSKSPQKTAKAVKDSK